MQMTTKRCRTNIRLKIIWKTMKMILMTMQKLNVTNVKYRIWCWMSGEAKHFKLRHEMTSNWCRLDVNRCDSSKLKKKNRMIKKNNFFYQHERQNNKEVQSDWKVTQNWFKEIRNNQSKKNNINNIQNVNENEKKKDLKTCKPYIMAAWFVLTLSLWVFSSTPQLLHLLHVHDNFRIHSLFTIL